MGDSLQSILDLIETSLGGEDSCLDAVLASLIWGWSWSLFELTLESYLLDMMDDLGWGRCGYQGGVYQECGQCYLLVNRGVVEVYVSLPIVRPALHSPRCVEAPGDTAKRVLAESFGNSCCLKTSQWPWPISK